MNARMPPADNRPGSFAWILVIICLLFALFVFAWARIQCTQSRFAISAAIQKQEKLRAENQNLEIEGARLRSPDRIRTIAETRFGLRMPTPETTVILAGTQP